MTSSEIGFGVAGTVIGLLIGAVLAYTSTIQTQRMEHAANAYSEYLVAIKNGHCDKSAAAKAKIAAHGSQEAIAAIAALNECAPCRTQDGQNLLVAAVLAIQDHLRPFSEATATKSDIRDIFCPR